MTHAKPRTFLWSAQPDREVVLCGIGARTPLGFGASASAAALRGSISGITVHPDLLDKVDEPIALACDSGFEPGLGVAIRLDRLLSSAIEEAFGDAAFAHDHAQVKCWIGLPEPRPGLPDDIAAHVAAHLSGSFGFSLDDVRVLQRGHASGLMAIQAAAQQISSGEAEVCLVACADSYRDSETLAWLDQTGWLMSASNRNGFPPGEAGGACLIASGALAHRLGLPVLATLASACTAVEAIAIRDTSGVCVGEALSAVIKGASSVLRLPDEAITESYCDLNGQRYRNEELSYTLLRVQEAFVDAHDYLCPADCWGDVGAASGALYAALAVSANRRGYSKGVFPLLWAGSESGYRAATILKLKRG